MLLNAIVHNVLNTSLALTLFVFCCVVSEAKDFMIRLFLEGSVTECDSCEASEITLELPKWYDEAKFKR